MSNFLDISWFLWGVFSLFIALIFFFFVPDVSSTMSGWRLFMLRYGHSLVWILLAVSFFFREYEKIVAANLIGIAAGICYLIFLIVVIENR